MLHCTWRWGQNRRERVGDQQRETSHYGDRVLGKARSQNTPCLCVQCLQVEEEEREIVEGPGSLTG